MIYLTNFDGNVKMGFDFPKILSEDFYISESKFEKWVPFVLNISTPGRTIAITEDMKADMTIYEVERIYNGLKSLIESIGNEADRKFTHYSSENFFEISFEYLHVDDCFDLELWFIIAKSTEGALFGYDDGFRFIVEKSEMIRFVEECSTRFKEVCSQCHMYNFFERMEKN